MRRAALLFVSILALLPSACDRGGATPPEVKIRSRADQLTYGGELDIGTPLNRYVNEKTTASLLDLRSSLRKPMMRVFELLKGPDVTRRRPTPMASLQAPFGDESSGPRPELVEVLRLAGFRLISLGTRGLALADEAGAETTVQVLRDAGIAPVGLAGADGAPLVHRTAIGDTKASIVGFGFVDRAPRNEVIAAYETNRADAAVAAAKAAFSGDGDRGALSFAVVGWADKQDSAARRKIAHALIDDAGVDVVLGHFAGAFEGIEAHGGGLVVYNPGLLFSCNVAKDSIEQAFVYRIHLAGGALSWVEAQPIELRRRSSNIGMGTANTYGAVDKLVAQSAKLDTKMGDEFGRGILDLPVANGRE
ncbi:MAG: CapA family protein [Proteobacteria bacterium]|jgi:hypothetical protein|nr:CapA family protein [Pseudomonadota bacterium]